MAWMRGAGIGVVACAIACGPVAGQPEDDGPGTRGDSGEEDTGAPAESSGETTGGGDDDADATTASADESTGEPSTLWCGATEPTQPLAVLSGEAGASVMYGDGSIVPLALPDAMAPEGANVSVSFTARGDRLAVVTSWALLEDGFVSYGAQLALLSAAGELLWTREESVGLSAAYLGADGSLVLTRDGIEGLVLFGPDDEIVLPNFWPTGALSADGWIRGYTATQGGTSVPGWMSTDLEFQGLRASPLPTWHVRPDGAYVYFAAADATPALVVDTPAKATDVPLPMLAGIDQTSLYVSSSPAVAWLLVHESEGRWWRVSVGDGAMEELALAPPDGAMALECYQPAAVIDDTGRALLSTRDASSAAVMQFDPVSSAWATMGGRVTDVDDMGALVFGETVLVHSAGSGETFCPPQTYERSDAPLSGSTQQLVRPIDDVTYVLPPQTWASVDAAGVCAGLATAEGVTIIDLVQSQQLPIAGVQVATWWQP